MPRPPALPHWHAPPPSSSRMDSPAIFWIKWSCNTDLSKTYVMVCPRPRSCDAPRALMSITPNHFCDETRTKEHTLAWHLCRDSGLTWLKQPRAAGTQLSEAPAVEAEHKRKPRAREVTRSPLCWKLGQQKTTESSCGSASDSRRPLVELGGPCSYGWRDMPKKILIPLQSLVSGFLEPPANRQVAVGAIEGLWRGYSSVCPKGTICWAPVAVTKPVGVTLSLLFSVPRIRPMKTVSTSQIFSKFSGGLWRGFLGTFFPLLFPPVLQLYPGTRGRPKSKRWIC